VTEAIEKTSTSDPEALKKYYKYSDDLLLEIVNLVRSDVSNIHRITLGVLVVVEVHAKDVVKDLIDSEILNTNAFEWLA
jgi:dynein heavy chain, axonemal